MKEIILFGRSMFINQVDVAQLTEKYETIGLNFFGQYALVDYLFCYMEYVPSDFPTAKEFTHWEHEKVPDTVTKIRYKTMREPILKKTYDEQGNLILGMFSFSSGAAINWAILEGYERIYLVGIDNVETDTAPQHFDGKAGIWRGQQSAQLHQEFKEYVYACAKHIEIVQCNPAVKDEWKLPYFDFNTLYQKQTLKGL